MTTYTLEFENGKRDYISAANYSQARLAADKIAAKSKVGFKLREATAEEQAILLKAHSLDAGDE